MQQPKSEFQKEFEELLQQNKQLFEDVELNSKTSDEAAISSANLFQQFINKMRYPDESKIIILSGNENGKTQFLNEYNN